MEIKLDSFILIIVKIFIKLSFQHESSRYCHRLKELRSNPYHRRRKRLRRLGQVHQVKLRGCQNHRWAHQIPRHLQRSPTQKLHPNHEKAQEPWFARPYQNCQSQETPQGSFENHPPQIPTSRRKPHSCWISWFIERSCRKVIHWIRY